jgi:hypothetical protein
MKIYWGCDVGARLARWRFGSFSRGSWARRRRSGTWCTLRGRRVLQREVSAVERRVLRSRRDHDSLNGVASALQFRQGQADAERRRVLLGIHFRGRQQGGRVHLQPIPKKNQSRTKRVSIERFFVFGFFRKVSLEENIQRLALRKQTRHAGDDCFPVDFEPACTGAEIIGGPDQRAGSARQARELAAGN